MDRIDIHVGVPRLEPGELKLAGKSESSSEVRSRVASAFDLQLARQGCPNSQLKGNALEIHCRLSSKNDEFLEEVSRKLRLSLRGHHRLLRVARTLADLESSDSINSGHLMEAVGYRQIKSVD